MKKFLQKRLGNEKGLTLVELLAVIVILGIIAAIAVPSIGGIIQGSREKAVIADAQNALAAASIYFLDSNSKDGATVTLTQHTTAEAPTTMVAGGLKPDYLEDNGTLTTVTVTKVASGNTIAFSGTVGSSKTVATKVNTPLTKAELANLDKAGLKALVSP